MCLGYFTLTELYCVEISVTSTINKPLCPTLALFRGRWLRLLSHSIHKETLYSVGTVLEKTFL